MVSRILQPEIARLCAELASDGVKRSEVGFILQLSDDQVERILKFKGITTVKQESRKKCLCCGERMDGDWLYPICPTCEANDKVPPLVFDPVEDELEYSRFLAVLKTSNYFQSNISRATRRIALRAGISCLSAIRFEIRREWEIANRKALFTQRRQACRDLLASGKTNAEMIALGWSKTFVRDTRHLFRIHTVPLREKARLAKLEHPELTNGELATLLGVEERSVYDALRPKISKRREIQEYHREYPDLSIPELARRLNVTTGKVFAALRKDRVAWQTLPLPFDDDWESVN